VSFDGFKALNQLNFSMDVGGEGGDWSQRCWQDDVSRCDYRQVQPTQGQVLFKERALFI